MAVSYDDLGFDEVDHDMTRYRYMGRKPYLLVVDGVARKLYRGDYMETRKGKLNTVKLRKLFTEVKV